MGHTTAAPWWLSRSSSERSRDAVLLFSLIHLPNRRAKTAPLRGSPSRGHGSFRASRASSSWQQNSRTRPGGRLSLDRSHVHVELRAGRAVARASCAGCLAARRPGPRCVRGLFPRSCSLSGLGSFSPRDAAAGGWLAGGQHTELRRCAPYCIARARMRIAHGLRPREGMPRLASSPLRRVQRTRRGSVLRPGPDGHGCAIDDDPPAHPESLPGETGLDGLGASAAQHGLPQQALRLLQRAGIRCRPGARFAVAGPAGRLAGTDTSVHSLLRQPKALPRHGRASRSLQLTKCMAQTSTRRIERLGRFHPCRAGRLQPRA